MLVLMNVLVVSAYVKYASGQSFCKLGNDAWKQFCFEPGYINGLRRCNTYEPEDVIVRPGCSGPNRYSNQSLAPKRCVDGEWQDVFSCTSATSTALSTAANNRGRGGGGFTTPAPPPRSPSQDDIENNQCGRVVLRTPPVSPNGSTPLIWEGQWPWQVAIYQTKSVDNKYMCGGTLVSHKHVITVAHCVTRRPSGGTIDTNTLTVYLGKHNLRTSVKGVQIKFVDKISVHPDYNSSTFSRDIAILQLSEAVSYTDWVQPACLWPEDQIDLSYVIGKKGLVAGWGYDDTEVVTEELNHVEMPVVDQQTCIWSYIEFFGRHTSNYTFCAGSRDNKTNSPVCNGGTGNGMMFKIGESWYLRGFVSLAVAKNNGARCDPTHYVVFTDVAKFLPWIKQIVTTTPYVCTAAILSCCGDTNQKLCFTNSGCAASLDNQNICSSESIKNALDSIKRAYAPTL